MKHATLCSARLLTLFFLLIGMAPVAHAQAPDWQMAMAISPTATSTASFYVQATAADSSGNIYLTGGFSGTIQIGNTSLNSAGNRDIFIAKWNPAIGQFSWAQRAGGTDYDYPSAIAVSSVGVYVVGTFSGATAGFGTSTLTNYANAVNAYDAFVTKLTDTGNFVWAQKAGGIGTDGANAIAVSGPNVYVTGAFNGATANFGNIALVNTSSNGFSSSSEGFIAKLTDFGSSSSFVWAKQVAGTLNETVHSVAVNGPNIYITGIFGSPILTLGSLTIPNNNSRGGNDAFVAKLSDAGNTASFIWAHCAGGMGMDSGVAIAVNGPSIYLTGIFSSIHPPTNGNASIPAVFGNITLFGAGSDDIFVAKLTDRGSTGDFIWAQQAGGAGGDWSLGLAVKGNEVYVTGFFAGNTATFGATTLFNATVGGNNDDVFVAKLTDLGTTSSFAWAQRAGGLGPDIANSVTVTGTSVYVAGTAPPPASFGTHVTASTNAFLALLDDVSVLTLTGFSPSSGSVGANVTLTGADFTNATAITFNGIMASNFTVNSSTQITVTVPGNASSGIIGVITPRGIATSSTSFAVQTVTGTLPAIVNLSLACFPNPAHSQIKLVVPTTPEATFVTLLDALGRTARTYPLPAHATTATLDLRGLAPGLYVVRCGAATGRLVVE